MATNDIKNHPLAIMLQTAVPLRIMELKEKGGPAVDDFKKATDFSSVLAEKGDILFFGSKKKGEAADLVNRLAKSIAVLAFVPGGIDTFGCRFEASTTHD